MRLLMCPPDHFGVEYEINPWMHLERGVDHATAQTQWRALYDAYVALGVTVELAPPVKGLPDMVFSANAALTHAGTAVLARFQHAERQGEEVHWREVLSGLGQRVLEVPAGMRFEGAGDALLVGTRLFAGHGFRTDQESHPELARMLDVEVVSLQLVDPRFYHLDTCFCPLGDAAVMFAPAAFDEPSAQVIRDVVPEVIEVPAEIAVDFICNGVVVGDHLLSSAGVEKMATELRSSGLQATPFAMTEFMKAGGGVRCLTLELD